MRCTQQKLLIDNDCSTVMRFPFVKFQRCWPWEGPGYCVKTANHSGLSSSLTLLNLSKTTTAKHWNIRVISAKIRISSAFKILLKNRGKLLKPHVTYITYIPLLSHIAHLKFLAYTVVDYELDDILERNNVLAKWLLLVLDPKLVKGVRSVHVQDEHKVCPPVLNPYHRSKRLSMYRENVSERALLDEFRHRLRPKDAWK